MNDEYDGLKNNKFCPLCLGNVKVYANTNDFLDWINDVSYTTRNPRKRSRVLMNKFSLENLKYLSEVFIAYCTHINSTNNIIDTPEYRRIWFNTMKWQFTTDSFIRAGFNME